jgi:hypothetical protein
MKKIIFCVVVCFLNLPAVALTYSDFPPNVQRILDERADELTAGGGVCVAGRVIMSDGAHISGGQDVQVNFFAGIDDPLWIYDDGWFAMGRPISGKSIWPGSKVIVRAFGYDPGDVSVAVPDGQITYLEVTLVKTAPEKLASIEGVVFKEPNELAVGAHVTLSFPFSSHGMGNTPEMELTTGADGRYRFDGLSLIKYSLAVSASDYAYDSMIITPSAGQAMVKDFKLYRNRKIKLDYVYQADGDRSFTGGKLQSGTLEWGNGHQGLDFSDGRVEEYEHGSERDIEMRQYQGSLKFQIFYVDSKINNGFYDAGAVTFDSVVEAAEKGYDRNAKACVAGHVYVVKTYEGNYAKFIVKEVQ